MKVFVVESKLYSGIELYSLNTDLTKVEWISKELDLLIPSYQDEYDEFLADLKELQAGGRVSFALIEERLIVTVEEVIDGSSL